MAKLFIPSEQYEYIMKTSSHLILLMLVMGLMTACASSNDRVLIEGEKPDEDVLETIGFDELPSEISTGDSAPTISPESLPTTESVPDDDILELVAWNLGAFVPVKDRRYYKLRDAIISMDPEVLAIVEVNFSFVASALAMDLSDSDACYKRKIILQPASQDIAVIHKCHVDVTAPRLIPGSNDNNSRLRKALAVDVRSDQFDFVLITVHMKADRSSASRDIRTRQANAIAAWIDEQKMNGSERDYIIVGDYNMIPGSSDDETFDALGPAGSLNFVSTKIFLDDPATFTHVKESGQPGNYLDGFAISATDTPEYRTDSIEVIQLHEQLGLSLRTYARTVSDHLPMKATFSTNIDDD